MAGNQGGDPHDVHVALTHGWQDRSGGFHAGNQG